MQDKTQANAIDQPSFLVNVSGKGSPLILIPGLMSNGSIYDELAAHFAKQYQVHVLSVKGFAGVPPNGQFSLQQLADDIVAYIESVNLQKPSIIGHSLGGLLAFKLACEHENLIGKAISIDGLPFIGPIFTHNNATTVAMLNPQAQSMRMMFSSMNGAQLAMQAQQGIYIQAKSPLDQMRIIEMTRTSNPSTAGKAMFDVMQTDLRKPLAKTNTPILMLGASGAFMQLSKLPHQQVDLLYKSQFKNVKNATVIMNPTARHYMMFDDPQWLIQQIEEFL